MGRTQLPAELVAWLARHGGQPQEVEPLAGDGSQRCYDRLRYADGSTRVLMRYRPDQQCEELGGGVPAGGESAFVAIGHWLAAAALPVPEIHAVEAVRGWVLLEDLGDRTLEALHGEDREAARQAYEAALSDLVRFQLLEPISAVEARRFDDELYLAEFDHFLEYGIEALLGRSLPEPVRTRVRNALGDTATLLAAGAMVPVHRDFHSRNLMMVDDLDRPRWIDFQDALMGSPLYDVASLLWDAYVELDDSERAELWDHYRERAALADVPLVADWRLLGTIAAQRMLKAAGRFVFFDRERSKSGYLRYVPTLVARVDRLAAAGEVVAEFATAWTTLRPYALEAASSLR